jgi:ubiquinone/menaquinone biosynthesis C-methylase UbiE
LLRNRQDKKAEIRFFNKATDKKQIKYMKEEQQDLRMILPFIQSGALLDVGCGEGYFGSVFPSELSVVGIDLASKSLQRAKSLFKIEAFRELIPCDAKKLPFCESSFDVVFCRFVLHHFPDPIPLLREAQRILGKKGKIIIVESNGSNPINKLIRTLVRHLLYSGIRDRNIATPNEVVHSAHTYTKFLTDHKFITTEIRSWHPARSLHIRSIFGLLIATRELLFETTGMLPQPYCDNKLSIVATKP